MKYSKITFKLWANQNQAIRKKKKLDDIDIGENKEHRKHFQTKV